MPTPLITVATAVTLMWCITLSTVATHQQHSHVEYVHGSHSHAEYEPTESLGFQELSAKDDETSRETSSTFYMRVQPDADVVALRENLLLNHNVHLYNYVGDHTFVIESVHSSMRDISRAHFEVLSVDDDGHGQELPAHAKLAPNTLCENVPEHTSSEYVLDMYLTHNPHRTEEQAQDILTHISESVHHTLEVCTSTDFRTQMLNTAHFVSCYSSFECLCASAMAIAEKGGPIFLMERRSTHVTFDNKWSRGIWQNGLTTTANYEEQNDLVSWRYGLLGQDQVIGIADSGIDERNCFLQNQPGMDDDPHVPWVEGEPVLNQNALNNSKVVSYVDFRDGVDMNGHGSHVVSTAVGKAVSGPSSLQHFNGGAPESRVAFFDLFKSGDVVVEPPLDVGMGMLRWAYDAGARVYSLSIGDVPDGSYGTLSRAIDEFCWQHKHFIVVVSAGNDGNCLETKTVSAPATAKSVVAVGSMLNNIASYQYHNAYPRGYFDWPDPSSFDEDDIAAFSAIGPTNDGRMKPDIMAPGYGIYSAQSGTENSCTAPESNILSLKSGTSMSAPSVAASLALIRQYYMAGFVPTGYRRSQDVFEPSGSLMKATLLAGARMPATAPRRWAGSSESQTCPYQFDEGLHELSAYDTSRPHNHMGWGRVQLNTVLEFAEEPGREMQYLHVVSGADDTEHTHSGDVHTYNLCMEPQSASVLSRVVLVWTDAVSSAASGAQLVNNLDLEVHVGDTVKYGNGGEYADTLNPVEVVQLEGTQTYQDVQIRVTATAVPVGPQPYSLVVSGPLRFSPCQKLLDGEFVDDGKDYEATPQEVQISRPFLGNTADSLSTNTSTTAGGNSGETSGLKKFIQDIEEFVIANSTVVIIGLAAFVGVLLLVLGWRAHKRNSRTATSLLPQTRRPKRPKIIIPRDQKKHSFVAFR